MKKPLRFLTTVAATTALAVLVSTANISAATANTEAPEAEPGIEILVNDSPVAEPDTSASEAPGIDALDPGNEDLIVEVIDDAEGFQAIVEGEEVEGVIEVVHDEDAAIDELLEAVKIDAVVDGESVSAELLVRDFTFMGEEDFTVILEDAATGEEIRLSSVEASAQAFPVLWVLGVLAKVGIKALIKHIGKTQVKKAVKSYLLNNIKANKWKHIMDPKHKWGSVGAKSKEQIADLMGRAMAEGRHSAYGSAMQAQLAYKGKTIVVTYSRSGGQVSNGWIK